MITEQIQKLIESEIKLPSPPAVAVQILNAVQKEDGALKVLTKIISADPALTGKMLQIANSGFYALKNEVTSIDRALTVLGTNVIKNIALSFVIATDLRGEEQSSFDFDGYWRHSLTSAVAAELLTQQLAAKNDNIFVTALLHDIGMLALFMHKRDEYSQLIQSAALSKDSILELEEEKYHFNHQQVGSMLVNKWGLPNSIYEPIGYHHNPELATDKNSETAQILYFSDQIATIYNGADSAQKVRTLNEQLTAKFAFNAEQIRSLLDDVAEKSIEIMATFAIDPGDIKPYSQMLQEANEELGRLNLTYEQIVIELKQAKDKSDQLSRELKKANLRLKDLVYIDALTGLYNHRFFQENLNSELSRARRYHSTVSIVLFDIDFFKNVNDTYGHPAGDQVLINIASEIKKIVRPSDIVARYGGEEFMVILPETDITSVKVFAARIRRCVEGLITKIEDQQIMVTVSLGGTTFSSEHPEFSKDDLIQTADRGLYMSKNNGRNQATILETKKVHSP